MKFLLCGWNAVMVMGILLLAVLAVPVSASMSAPMNARDLTGTNMAGIDHWNTFTNSAQECADLCDATAGCEGATYVLPNTIQGPNGVCWRKSAVTGDVENFNCISFRKQAAPPGGGCTGVTPLLKFSLSPEGWGYAPLTVQFTDQSTGAQKWNWIFGDGSGTSNEQNPVYTYTVGSPTGYGYMGVHGIEGACSKTNGSYFAITVYDNAGQLSVDSTPPGATVIINGKTSGTTPYISESPIPLGTYTVALKLAGYNDYATTMFTKNGVIRHLHADLVKTSSITTTITTGSASPGTLQVTTTPDDAAVYVDGGSQGTTPKTIAGLSSGSHTVKLVKAGYIDYQGTVTVQAGQATLLDVKLVAGTGTSDSTTPTTVPTTTSSTTQVTITTVPPSQAPTGSGTLSVISTPAGANVYLDGKNVGTTPARIQNVTAGTHRLLLTLQGYNNIQQVVDITSGKENEASADFTAGKKTPGFGTALSLAAVALTTLIMLVRRENRNQRVLL